MASQKISQLTEKTTFGDDDFLAGTQGTGATDNRKYGNTAIQHAVANGKKTYVALLTQSGTDAPVATVLENTIGNIAWSRNAAGQYTGTLNGAFTPSKTVAFIGSANDGDPATISASTKIGMNDVDSFSVLTGAILGSTSDGLLLDTAIQITVYP